jgi:hypothetical protein
MANRIGGYRWRMAKSIRRFAQRLRWRSASGASMRNISINGNVENNNGVMDGNTVSASAAMASNVSMAKGEKLISGNGVSTSILKYHRQSRKPAPRCQWRRNVALNNINNVRRWRRNA